VTEDVKQENGFRSVRELARRGDLVECAAAAAAEERRRLRTELYEIIQPVVFTQLTRKVEIKRGHIRCAVSVRMLEDDCIDRFHDDMDAVLDDVFRNARATISNLEGWVSKRLTAVTVDAHRRRRGERGALQRPRRIPGWLAESLNRDVRLTELAADMLEFVGMEAVAGLEVWPVDAWAARRAMENGDYVAARRAVLRDVETVVAAMRRRPKWYDDYVERPLGRKRVPLLPGPRTGQGMEPASCEAAADARLTELAAVAVAAIENRMARGEEPRTVVVDVLNTVFGSGKTPADEDRMAVDLVDEVSIDRLVSEVLAIVTGGRS
jgi:hypothetical protein